MKMRCETGLIEFKDDWPGVFIRGDDCFGHRQALALLLKATNNVQEPLIKFVRLELEVLYALLEASDTRITPSDAVPLLKSFEDCVYDRNAEDRRRIIEKETRKTSEDTRPEVGDI